MTEIYILFSGQYAIIQCYIDSIRIEITTDNLFSDNGFNVSLYESSKRTCTKVSVIATINDIFLCLIAYIEFNVSVRKTFAEVIKHKVNNIHNVVFCKWLIENNFVKSVKEFRTEFSFKECLNIFTSLF